jgi:hypothetical protein
LAKYGHVVRITTKRRDLIVHPAQTCQLVQQSFIARGWKSFATQVDASKVSEDAEAVVDGDNHHVSTSGQRGASEDWRGTGTEGERASVQPDHYRASTVVNCWRPHIDIVSLHRAVRPSAPGVWRGEPQIA